MRVNLLIFEGFQPQNVLTLFLSFMKTDSSLGIEYFKISLDRSSRPKVFCKKDVLRNFEKFTGKGLCQSLFFNKVASLTMQGSSCKPHSAALLRKRL